MLGAWLPESPLRLKITGSQDIEANPPSLPYPYPFLRIQRQGAQSRTQESATEAPITTNSVRGFPFLHTLSSIYYL